MSCYTFATHWVRIRNHIGSPYETDIKQIKLTKLDYVPIPRHLDEHHHHQYAVMIDFQENVTHDRARMILDYLRYEWYGLSSDEQGFYADAGSVFTRPNQSISQLWCLKTPCLDCFIVLQRECGDLQKSLLRSFI